MVEFFCWYCEDDEYLLHRHNSVITIKSEIKKENSDFIFHNYQQLLNRIKPKTKSLIKIDPDSKIHYLPKQYPKADWFGQIINQREKRIKTTWGCGMGISVNLISLFLDNYLELKKILSDEYYERGFSEDLTFGKYLNYLGYFPEHWSEVCLRLEYLAFLDNGKWAITHPHK